jgi:NAD+ synthase (glutamine-hydrolysing)
LLLALGCPVSVQGRNYNCLAICEDGRLRGFYTKQILANRGVFYENRWFDIGKANQCFSFPGREDVWFGDFTLSFRGLEIGFEICEDAWHPDERPALIGAAKRAQLILNASASNFARGKQPERHAVIESLKGRHNAWYLYANLLGNESGHLIFDGELMFGKGGNLLQTSPILSMQSTKVEVFELDEELSWPGPATGSNDYEEFTAAACLGLKDYLQKSGSKGFTLSLSGGADSAACAVLVSQLYHRMKKEVPEQAACISGMKNFFCCVYQASEHSGPITRGAAVALAQALDTTCFEWDISQPVAAFTAMVEQSLNRKLSWQKDDLCLQNIQARSRAPGIWMMANVRNHLLLTTGNRSEADVGYCTMDGDTAGSLAPIAGVSKHFIRQWLQYARDAYHLPVLDLIINQEPTAELRPVRQTDEGDIMPYELLEQIEVLFLAEKKSPPEILNWLLQSRGESREYLQQCIDRFMLMWKRNQWKRERLAPSFHLDRFNVVPRSMGRYPIFCGGQ